MPRQTSKPAPSILLGKAPGQHARDQVKTHLKYTGPLPDFKGQWRCHTGVQDMGKDRIILIRPDQFEAKREKYPALRKIEEVQ